MPRSRRQKHPCQGGETPRRPLFAVGKRGGGKQAVRMGDWKGVRLNCTKEPNGPIELYNLHDDSDERVNVADKHPQVVKVIARIMASRTKSVVPAWNFPPAGM